MSSEMLNKIRAKQGLVPKKHPLPEVAKVPEVKPVKPQKDSQVKFKERQQMRKGRLPDGSAFAVHYNAMTGRWSGTLTIPSDEGGVVYSGQDNGVFKLLEGLDNQYRADLVRRGLPDGLEPSKVPE